MNSVVTYDGNSVAYLSSEGMLSWVTSTVYGRFSGGGYLSGVKLVRGWSDTPREQKRPRTPPPGNSSATSEKPEASPEAQQKLKRRSAPPAEKRSGSPDEAAAKHSSAADRRNMLQRQLSSLMESKEKNQSNLEEDIRLKEEQEIRDDYNPQAGETQGRDIEHLVLVTHGIGQLLGLK